VQVDRAVKTKAASLASVLGVSNQHAMGTLVEFWELCGDPRELEKLLGAGNTEVVFNRDEIVARFKIASGGKLIDPSDLVTLGLLEQRDDGSFRVRGMSRYFAPIEKRRPRVVRPARAAPTGRLGSLFLCGSLALMPMARQRLVFCW
jgi:hypothetical protein